mgnify:CR=1 FL=1
MADMSTPPFVHLRLHSEYSITDGIARIDDAVAAAKADGMPALALTDLANVFGMVKFYKAARGKGIKPIIGNEMYVINGSIDDPQPKKERRYHLVVLAKNATGYHREAERRPECRAEDA